MTSWSKNTFKRFKKNMVKLIHQWRKEMNMLPDSRSFLYLRKKARLSKRNSEELKKMLMTIGNSYHIWVYSKGKSSLSTLMSSKNSLLNIKQKVKESRMKIFICSLAQVELVRVQHSIT